MRSRRRRRDETKTKKAHNTNNLKHRFTNAKQMCGNVCIVVWQYMITNSVISLLFIAVVVVVVFEYISFSCSVDDAQSRMKWALR